MKKVLTLPKKKSVTRHQAEPVKVSKFPTDTDPTSLTTLSTTHII